MTTDRRFTARLRRLIGVSAVALGLVVLLAVWSGADAVARGLLIAGWISMPALLAAGLERPAVRYSLVLPAGLVGVGMLITAIRFDGSVIAGAGWWSMAGGVMLGGSLGGWFWFRWAPVPRRLDDPFSSARWSLIAVHVTLVVAGALLVAVGM